MPFLKPTRFPVFSGIKILKKVKMKYILFFLIFLLPVCCRADLDEIIIRSEDQKCAIRYLTQTPVKGQIIHTTKQCPTGWVQGYASVEITNPQSPVKEELAGFFMDGYWLASFPGNGHVQDRYNPQENIQALTFILETDKKENITYLVQLRATRSENNVYSPFAGCPIFRLMAVVPDTHFFENEVLQDKIATQAFLFAKHFCSELETIAVFGSTKINARTSDIFFQMQIDADTLERTIIPIQSDIENESSTIPVNNKNESDISETLVSMPKTDSRNNTSAPPFLMTSLNHLNIRSKLTQKPVQGRAIVHIQSVNLDGSAWVDLPQKTLLKYHPKLKIGWAIIQGRFFENQMHVQDIQFCQKEWCSDVS